MKNNLRVLRAEYRISQAELATKCGVSRAAINQIENECVIPNGDTLVKISKALNLPIEKIFLDFVVCVNNKTETERS